MLKFVCRQLISFLFDVGGYEVRHWHFSTFN